MAAFVLLGVTAWLLYSRLSDAPVVDLIEYWSAARILRHGGNPYSPEQMLVVERAAGWSQARPLLMWNPPWTLPFVLPMAWLSYETTYLLWALLNVAIVVFCGDTLWSQFGGTPKGPFVWLIALTFVPTVIVIHLGQIGPLMLLGITTFLIWREKRPLMAGMATLCIGLKPQLLYLFWIALALWVIRDKRWRILAGAMIAFGAAALVGVYFRPTIFMDYVAQFHAAPLLANPSPNLGTLMRSSFLATATWLQFAPSLAGAAWFLWYWMKRAEWEWSRQISLLLLVSLVTTSYGWLFDQVTLLPAVMQAVAVMQERSNALRNWTVTISYLLINAGIILSIRLHAVGIAYAWVAPAWLALYLLMLSPLRHGHGRELVRH